MIYEYSLWLLLAPLFQKKILCTTITIMESKVLFKLFFYFLGDYKQDENYQNECG